MRTRAKRCRLLAIEIRTQKLGYAVFESPSFLLDWGVRSFEKGGGTELVRKIRRLFDFFQPTIVLLSHVHPANRRNGHSVNSAILHIKEEAKSLSIPAKAWSKVFLRKHFRRRGRWNKREVAEAIAKRFPELAWHLPRRRKIWDSEPKKQLVFDAAALALHYFAVRASGENTKK